MTFFFKKKGLTSDFATIVHPSGGREWRLIKAFQPPLTSIVTCCVEYEIWNLSPTTGSLLIERWYQFSKKVFYKSDNVIICLLYPKVIFWSWKDNNGQNAKIENHASFTSNYQPFGKVFGFMPRQASPKRSTAPVDRLARNRALKLCNNA